MEAGVTPIVSFPFVRLRSGGRALGCVEPPLRRRVDDVFRGERREPDRVAELRYLTDRVRASAWWSCERCQGEAFPVELDVTATGAGLELRVRVPAGHTGHALTLRLPPVEPEA